MASKDLTFNLFGRDINASASMRKVAASAEESSRAMKRSFGVLPKLAAEATAGAVAGSVYMATKFQSQMSLLQSAADLSSTKVAAISAGVKTIAGDTGTSLDQLGEGAYTVAKAFGNEGAAGQLRILRAAAEGAKAEHVDLATATSALTSIMASYGGKMKDPIVAQNELVRASGLSKTTMQDFAASLPAVIPLASALGVKFSEVGGAIATMTQHGETAQRASENLGNLLTNLAGQSHQSSTTMQQLGINVVDLQQHLGERGISGTLNIVEEALKRNSKGGMVVVDAFNKSATATQDLNTMLKSMTPSARALSEQWSKGQISTKDYTKEMKGLGSTAYTQSAQFKGLYTSSQGFSQALKSGNPQISTAASMLQHMLGGVTGMRTALMLSGNSAKLFHDNVAAIGEASKHSGKDISSWAVTQKNTAVQMDRLKESVAVLGVNIGTALLPAVNKVVSGLGGFFTALNAGNPAARNLAVAVAVVAGALTAAYLVQKTYAAGAMIVQASMIAVRGATLLWRGVLLLLRAEIVLGRGVMIAWMAATRLAAAAQSLLVDGIIKGGAAWVASTAKTVASTVVLVAQKATMIAGTVVTWAATAATTAFGVAVDIATGPVGLIILAVIALIAGIVLLVTHWKQVCAFLQTVWGAVCKWFADTLAMIGRVWNTLWQANLYVIRAVWNAIVGVVKAYITHVHDTIVAVVNTIRDFFKNAGTWLLDAGRNIIDGLVNGIKGAIGFVTSTVSNIAGGVIGTFKNVLGIHSPSTVFHNFGSNIGQGLTNGLLGTAAQVQGATNRLADTVIGMFEKRRGGISAGAERMALSTISSGTSSLIAEANKRADLAKQITATQKNLTKELAAQRKLQDGTVVSNAVGAGDITKFGSTGAMIDNLRSVIINTRRFKSDLQQLVRSGIDQDTFRQLVNAGVSGGGLAAADQLLANPLDFKQIVGLQRELASSANSLGSFVGATEYAPTVNATRARLAALQGAQRVEGWKSQKTAAGMIGALERELHIHLHLTGHYAGTKTDLAKTITTAIRDEVRNGRLPKNVLTAL